MKLNEVIWKERFVEKLDYKHHVDIDEVEDVLFTRPHIRRVQKGHIKGEDLYAGYGQTQSGRYLIVFFVLKPPNIGFTYLSARNDSR